MPERFLSPNERRDIIRVVSELHDFTDSGPRGRRVFIDEIAGLGKFLPGIDLYGTSRGVAANLVGKLEKHGSLAERPAYHALGALLDAVLSLRGEIPEEDRSLLANFIVRYSLVADEAYIKKLRTQFEISVAVEKEPDSLQQSPPSPAGTAISGPEFEVSAIDTAVLEEVINSEDNFLDIHMMYGAIYCSKAVCRIEIPEGRERGTGFLINHDVLLTNQHVIKNDTYLDEAFARFDFIQDASGIRSIGKAVKLETGFYYSSPAEDLDYAMVKLKEKPMAHMSPSREQATMSIQEMVLSGKHRGYLTLSPRKIFEYERVNIIQHPGGDPLKVVMTQNYVSVDASEKRVQYVADTMDGSSGSPVLDHNWQVVALHHSGGPYPPESVKDKLKKAWKGDFRVNEGVPIQAILKDIQSQGIEHLLPGG